LELTSVESVFNWTWEYFCIDQLVFGHIGYGSYLCLFNTVKLVDEHGKICI